MEYKTTQYGVKLSLNSNDDKKTYIEEYKLNIYYQLRIYFIYYTK